MASIDPNVDRLFAKVIDSPFYRAFVSHAYGWFEPVDKSIYSILVDLMESGTRLEELPAPIKAFSDACIQSFDVAKRLNLRYANTGYSDGLMPLVKNMPQEMAELESTNLLNYLGLKNENIEPESVESNQSPVG